MAAEESAAGAEPDLFADTLRDVVTGEEFRLADFAGRVIVLETMAVWCPLCTSQQEQLKRAREKLGDDVVFVSVDVDPNENEDVLSRYVESRGWDWSFVAPGADFARRLSSVTSRLVLEPTATPCRCSTIMSVVNRSGKMSVHERIDIDPERTGKAPSAQRYPGRSDISG